MNEELLFRGEIIVHRRNNLNFKLPLAKVSVGITTRLPVHSYEETIDHYNKKLSRAFANISKGTAHEFN